MAKIANGFSPQMYSEGAVVFDSSPTVRLQEQITNRQLAKDEAMDKLFTDMNKSINPAGVRVQDTEGFMARTNQLRDFYQQNRNAIRNPRNDSGKAYNEYYGRYQDILGYLNKSKQAAAIKKESEPIFRDPEKRSRLTDQTMDDFSRFDLPLDDPNWQNFDASKLAYDPKPFETQKYLKGIQEGIKMKPAISVGATDPRTLTQTVTTTESLDNEGKQVIGQRAISQYKTDPSFKKFIDDLAKNTREADSLNAAFVKDFGAEIQSPEDLAAAWTLQNVQKERQTQKVQDDWMARQRYLQGQRIDLLNRRKSISDRGQADQDNWVLSLIDNITEEALATPEQFSDTGFAPTRTNDIPLSGFLATALVRDKQEPDALRVLENGKYQPIFYQRDDEGNIKRDASDRAMINETLSVPMTKEKFALQLGYRGQTKKGLGGTMQTATGNKRNPLPKGQPRTVVQDGHTYTWSEEAGTYQ